MEAPEEKQVTLSCGCRVVVFPGETLEAVERFHRSLHARDIPLEDKEDENKEVE